MLVATRQRREAWLNGSSGSSSMGQESKAWKQLWKIDVPAKIRMFLWRLSKLSLPTEDVRAHRHMATSDRCGICGSPDSLRHSLIGCSMSRCTWALVDEEVTHKMMTNTEPNAKQWLFNLLEVLSHEQFILASVSLWAIWSARRKAIHEGIFQSPQATYSFVTRYIEEISLLRDDRNEASRGVAGASSSANQQPRAPPEGYVKIHVDGGVCTGRGGTAAAVCHNDHGKFLGSSALVISGVDDPASLEAIACREALSLAEDLHVQNLVISSDSKQVIADIQKGSRGTYGAIINEIKLRADMFNCNFIFEGRAKNVEAHGLARFSLSLGLGPHVWFGHSHDPRCIPQTVAFDE